MTVYTVTLFIVLIFAYLADHFRYRSPRLNLHGEKMPLLWFVLFVVLALTLVSGLRFMAGTDYVNYSIQYEDIRTNMAWVLETQQIEIGYVALSALFGLFFEAPFAFFFFIAALTNVIVIFALRKNSKVFWVSCVLYILTYLFFTSFNLVRQSVAMSIIFYAHQHIEKGNFVKYTLFILIAALFHASALIMIPIYFIVRRPAWSPVIWIAFAGTAAFLLLYDSVVGALFDVLSETRYSSYSAVIEDPTQGVSILRIGFAALPVVAAFVLRKGLREKIPDADIIANMVVIAFLVSVIAYKQIYFARISLYFNVYYLLLFPAIPGLFSDKKLRVLVLMAILVFYTVFCYMMLPTEGGVTPYQTILDQPHDWNVMDYINKR